MGRREDGNKKTSPRNATAAVKRDITPHLRELRRRLLQWFREAGRDYPWRKTGNWFHLLMAEMMLRRTRADQAARVYADFTESFRTPGEALEIPWSRVERMLKPLGLHWRGKQMRETLHYLRDHYGPGGPRRGDDLEAIPGVGPYSGAMIRTRLWNERVAAVDANVARFIARVHGLPHHAESRRDRDILHLADRFVDSKHCQALNLAIIDLSALVCRPRNPKCGECPLQAYCETGKNIRKDEK